MKNKDNTIIAANPDYQYAHSHKYEDGKVLAPIAVLKVDDQHPLPKDAQLNFVQIVELAEIGLQIVGNVIIKLTNLLNVGAVHNPPAPEHANRPNLLAALKELKDNESKLLDLASLARASIVTVAEDTEASVVDKLEDKVQEIGQKLEGLFGLTNKQKTPSIEQKQDHQSLASTILKGILKDIFEFLARKAIQAILTEAGLSGNASNLRDYADQFQTIVVPNIIATWQDAMLLPLCKPAALTRLSLPELRTNYQVTSQ